MAFPMLACLVIFLTSTAMVAGTTSDEFNIAVALAGKSDYTNVVQAFESNNLVKELASNGQPTTLLAPTNSAFTALPKDEVDAIKFSNTDSYVLRYHVLIGYFQYIDLYGLSNGSTIETLAGPRIDVTGGLPGGRVQFRSQNGGISYLSHPDVVTNGQLAVQGVDLVLVPAGIVPPSPSIHPNFDLPPPIAAPKAPPFPPGFFPLDSPAPSPSNPRHHPVAQSPQHHPVAQSPQHHPVAKSTPPPRVFAPPVGPRVPSAVSPPQVSTSVVVSGGSNTKLMGVVQWSHTSGLMILCLSACVGFVVMAPGNFFP